MICTRWAVLADRYKWSYMVAPFLMAENKWVSLGLVVTPKYVELFHPSYILVPTLNRCYNGYLFFLFIPFKWSYFTLRIYNL